LPSSPRINTSNNLSLNETPTTPLPSSVLTAAAAAAASSDVRQSVEEKKSHPSIKKTSTDTNGSNQLESATVAKKTKTEIEINLEPTIPAVVTTAQTKKSTAQIEQKTQSKEEIIPKFYFPNGLNLASSTNDIQLAKQLKQVKDEVFVPKQDKLRLEDFGKVAQLIGLSLYWKSILFRACLQDSKGSYTANSTISYSQFETFWKK